MLTNGNKETKFKVFFRRYKIGIVLCLLIVLCFLMYQIGGIFTCAKSGGKVMYGACVNIIEVGVCQLGGKFYLDDNGTPSTEGLNLTI